ncbi:hypothetical protein GCM10020219_020500 [Nonomuraea dietziae]
MCSGNGLSRAPRARGGVDEGAVDAGAEVVLLPPVAGGEPADGEAALQVHRDDRVELLLRGGDQAAHPFDARVVDHHVQVAEGLHRRGDHALRAVPVGDVVEVGDGLPARGDDLLDHGVSDRAVSARPVDLHPRVVDHDFRALLREEQRFFSADPTPGSGDEGDTPFESSHASMTTLNVLMQSM